MSARSLVIEAGRQAQRRSKDVKLLLNRKKPRMRRINFWNCNFRHTIKLRTTWPVIARPNGYCETTKWAATTIYSTSDLIWLDALMDKLYTFSGLALFAAPRTRVTFDICIKSDGKIWGESIPVTHVSNVAAREGECMSVFPISCKQWRTRQM